MIITIGLPIALQNLITFSVSMADTIMLGHASYDDELISAADLANKPIFLLIITLFGLAMGGLTLASQYWGKGDVKTIRRITAMILQMGVLISAAAGVFVLVFPAVTMRIFTNNEIVIQKGVEYLQIVGWSYFLVGFSIMMTIMLRSVEVVRVALFASIAALVLNIPLNWLLIFGNFGFPELGIQGAAIGTVIARAAEFMIIAVYVFLIDKKLKFRFKDVFDFDKTLFKDIMKYGFPVLFNEVAWASGITVQAMIVGRIDYVEGDFVAANAANGVIFQLFMVAMFGTANAALVIVGKAIGEGKLDEAKIKADMLFKIGAFMGIAVCFLIIATRHFIIGIFGLSPETEELAKELLIYGGIIAFFASVATMSIVGVFRGGGDTRFCLIIEVACMWGLAVPLAAVLAFYFQFPVWIVYLGMKSDEIVKTVICFIRIRGVKWIKILTR
ncbi:MAG: MATE family efflux transporter [Oscillospiraceae bacterium]|nr:MATE family efflux transporter [Oscillospiraceae bacterium]